MQSVEIILDEFQKVREEFEDIVKPGYGEVAFGFVHTLGMHDVFYGWENDLTPEEFQKLFEDRDEFQENELSDIM